jgi:3-hydroxy-3-methylglutaryl CoA synthase
MSDFGIASYGGYVPRLRIERAAIAKAHEWMAPGLKAQAKGTRAFKSWDEDAVTMAVEAARDALVGSDLSTLRALFLASTTAPYADLQNSAIVAGALRVPAAVRSFDIAGSQRAGTSGLIQALKAAEDSLFVASDAPVARPASTQELTYGAGAAAFVIGSREIIARLIATASVTDVFVDHFRATHTKFDYFWEERWVRDEGYTKLVPTAVKSALEAAGVGIADVAHFVMPSLFRGAADAVAKSLKFAGKVALDLHDGVGYAGAAHALLMLTAVLERARPGEKILLVGFGQGVDALLLETTEAIVSLPKRRSVSGSLADSLVTDSYMRLLSFYENVDLEWGMRSEKNAKTHLTEQYRSACQIEGFVAGRCTECGTVQFPQLQACVKCHAPAAQFQQMPLCDESAQVLTTTADWLSYHPAPPLHVGFVQFDNGARMLMEMVDIGSGGIARGQALRMVFRIKERDRTRGYNRYFWKSTPVASA